MSQGDSMTKLQADSHTTGTAQEQVKSAGDYKMVS